MTSRLRIGITGHRLLSGSPQLLAGLRRALGNLCEAFSGPYTLVSSLAEGADRLVLEAFPQQAELEVILPFPQEEYEKDFASSSSREAFRSLLARSCKVDCISPIATRPASYKAAGESMVNRSDVLVALWDGQPARGAGGTAEIVAFAKHSKKTIFWVYALNRPETTGGHAPTGATEGILSVDYGTSPLRQIATGHPPSPPLVLSIALRRERHTGALCPFPSLTFINRVHAALGRSLQRHKCAFSSAPPLIRVSVWVPNPEDRSAVAELQQLSAAGLDLQIVTALPLNRHVRDVRSSLADGLPNLSAVLFLDRSLLQVDGLEGFADQVLDWTSHLSFSAEGAYVTPSHTDSDAYSDELLLAMTDGQFDSWLDKALRLDLALTRPEWSYAYGSESIPRRRLSIAWGLFKKMVAPSNTSFPTAKLREQFYNAFEEWILTSLEATPLLNPSAISRANHFAWADTLATRYADLTRSAYVFNYLASSLAVLFSLLAFLISHEGSGPSSLVDPIAILELTMILGIISVLLVARRRRWLSRWISYRVLAERLRLLSASFIDAGQSRLASVVAEPVHSDHSLQDWVDHRFNTICMSLGLPDQVLNEEAIDRHRRALVMLGEKQLHYHSNQVTLCGLLEKRIHWIGLMVFIFSATSSIAGFLKHLPLSHSMLIDKDMTPLLLLGGAFLPSLGAALYGIVSESQLKHFERRSQRMEVELKSALRELSGAPTVGHAALERYISQHERLASLLLTEVDDWQEVTGAHPPSVP